MKNNGLYGNEKIAMLENKQRDIAEKLAAARERQRKHEAMLNKKICLALGEAVLQTAAQNEGFRIMLVQTIGPLVTDEKTRKLLAIRGVI
jgi:hypothetical protein